MMTFSGRETDTESSMVASLNATQNKTARWPLQAGAAAFYGDPRDPGWYAKNIGHVVCPWPLFMGNTKIPTVAIHVKCASSLMTVFHTIAGGIPYSEITKRRYDRYDGSYNFRPKRGGTSLSMHAYGAALDFDAADNPFHGMKHAFTEEDPLVQAFKSEGWIWGGDWSPGSIDAMHFQAARVHD